MYCTMKDLNLFSENKKMYLDYEEYNLYTDWLLKIKH